MTSLSSDLTYQDLVNILKKKEFEGMEITLRGDGRINLRLTPVIIGSNSGYGESFPSCDQFVTHCVDILTPKTNKSVATLKKLIDGVV